jgi:hypothetical protein
MLSTCRTNVKQTRGPPRHFSAIGIGSQTISTLNGLGVIEHRFVEESQTPIHDTVKNQE